MLKRRLPVKPSELNTKGDRLADNNWLKAEYRLLATNRRKQTSRFSGCP
jgi:hypothetical protein